MRGISTFLLPMLGCSGELGLQGATCSDISETAELQFGDVLHLGEEVAVGADESTIVLTPDEASQRGGVLTAIEPLAAVAEDCGEPADWTYQVTMEIFLEASSEDHGDGLAITMVDGSRLVDAAGILGQDPDLGHSGGCLACNGSVALGCESGATATGWTVELDTFQNSFPMTDEGTDLSAELLDPSELHLAISPDCAIEAPLTYLDLEAAGGGWDDLDGQWTALRIRLSPESLRATLADEHTVEIDGTFDWPDFLLISAATGTASALQAVRGVTTLTELGFESEATDDTSAPVMSADMSADAEEEPGHPDPTGTGSPSATGTAD